jgi:NAD(P)-dependent dehydrogenase (short-subunit alcohol dehydrogenase family)
LEDDMAEKKVLLITGAGRGMGVDIAKAALAAGHAVVATGRDPRKVTQAVGAADDLLTVRLDVTDPASAQAAVQAAVDRFGRIDVLVNNAGNFIAGFFEEITPEDFRAQLETNLFGPLNVTRAVLPFTSAYAAAKFGLEGWMESLAPEVAPFGIRTMIVEPGFFRTDLLTPESTSYAEPSIDDYAERTKQTVHAWSDMNGARAATPPSSRRRWSNSSTPLSRRCAGWPALTRSLPWITRRGLCSTRPARTATCPRRSRTTTPERPLPVAPDTATFDLYDAVADVLRLMDCALASAIASYMARPLDVARQH